MNYAEVERIQRVTSNYFFWQGLRWVPLGQVIMALGLRRTSWSPLAHVWEDLLLVCLAGLVTAMSRSVFALVLGAIYIIGGLLDHRELCRILRPVDRS